MPAAPDSITSPQNPRIKNLLKLQQKSSERRQQNLTIIEGHRELTIAHQAGVAVQALFVCPELATDAQLRELETLFGALPERFSVSKAVFEKVAYREGSDGVLALVRPPHRTLSDLDLPPNPLLLVLEAVEKPGNLGAILRTADAAQADAVIICDPRTDLYNPNAIRSSIGCIFTVPTVATTRQELLAWCAEKGIRTYAAALTPQARPYTQLDFRGPTAFVMGTEADGLTPELREACYQTIIIPMAGYIDSLNVSTATAILTFEAVRQRG
ncbi:RNA methyltransferase, TrmH family [Hymenobacter daecheongensis DSM 21074]|uniref:RNA methyltransferase, TrmH family n=1 Tax=Hymenobacter daecheongensis DSM 21074 TaxID=1121955 RepID=A0A1M6GQ50_9BACT|nr:RNA methyltransferase [Hymenobacter daecheongensis]SHJ12085.1 RNA methyltransferase, TrmH family [Hymenobacter daecheongensis DSM 21074]